MIEVHAEFPQREVIQANAVVDNEEKTVSEVIISAKPEITGVTASVDNETGTPYVDVTETGTGTEYSFDLAFHNLKGDKGEQGETGQTGNGIVSITKTASVGLEDDYTINFTNGTQTVYTVTNGADGQDGADGQAATITVGSTTTGQAGTSASVVNSGTSSAAILDFTIPKGDKGDTGNTGATGQDGFSPSASVSQSGGVTTISITDKNGTTTESIDLSNYATQTDLTNGLATKQDTISDLSTIRSNAANGQSAYTTIGGYGDIVTHNASDFVQKNGGSSTQTISLTSGTGTTALGIKSMATSSYISLSGSNGWLGSFGVTSNKRPAFYNGTGYTLAYTSEIPTDTSDLTNGAGFITGITSSDVTTALGYTPYDSTNPNGYTSNVGTVTSVNNTQPDANGNVTISSGSSTDVQINGTSITSGGVANILTESAYSSSNKIATMSDLPADEIFIATYGTTTFAEITSALSQNKAIICKNSNNYYSYANVANNSYYFTYATGGGYIFQVSVSSSDVWNTSATYMAETTSNKTSTISSSSTDTQYPSATAIINLLKTIYPVGSVYLSTNSTCPLSSLFGTWSLVSSGKALWTGTGSNGNTTISAGLPNIKGKIQGETGTLSGAFTLSSSFSTKNTVGGSGSSPNRGEISFSAASSNSIYSDSVTTVQPPAYVVNVWRRTA